MTDASFNGHELCRMETGLGSVMVVFTLEHLQI